MVKAFMRWDRDSMMLGLAILVAGCATKQPPTLAVPSPPKAPAVSAAAEAQAPQSATAKEAAPVKGTATPSATGAPKADPGAEATASGSQAGSGDPPVPPGEALTPDEQRDALDRRLASSLSSFDAMLLKEQKEVAEKRAEQASAGGQGSGTEGEGGGDGSKGASGTPGSRRDKAERGGQGSEQAKSDDRSTGPSRNGGGSSKRGGRTVTTAPEGTPPQGTAAVPKDVGDGHDDDIVARQIREAATKELDPAIREKLWEEYRRYKGIRKSEI
jgi:hypothetical protein